MTCKICGGYTFGALGGYCSVCFINFSPDFPQDLKDDTVPMQGLTLFGYPVVKSDMPASIGDIVLGDWKEWRGRTPIEKVWDRLARQANDCLN